MQILQARFGYVNEPVYIVKKKYRADNSTMLVLNSMSGQVVAVATVCLEYDTPAEGNVFIKDYSENLGMLAMLQKAGIVGPVIREVESGFVKVPECKLLMEDN